MHALPQEPQLDDGADLQPLDWAWDGEPILVLAYHGIRIGGERAAFRDCPKVTNPIIFRPLLEAAVATAELPDARPVPFDWNNIERSVAPRAWRLLSVLASWGVELTGSGPVRVAAHAMVHVLWQAYLRLEPIATKRDQAALGYALERARGALGDLGTTPDPIFAALAAALREDLEAAVLTRVSRELVDIEDAASVALLSARTPKGLERVEATVAAKTLRLRHAFGEFDGVAERISGVQARVAAALAARRHDDASTSGTAAGPSRP